MDGNNTKKVWLSEYYSSNFKQSVRVKGRDTCVKSLSQENSAAKMDEDKRQTCESVANLWKAQPHWSVFHPCCEKWSTSSVWGQRHVQWPFVDLEKPQEEMRLFFILWWFFSPQKCRNAPMIRPKFILLSFYYYCFVERWCSVAVQRKSIKPIQLHGDVPVNSAFTIRLHMKWTRVTGQKKQFREAKWCVKFHLPADNFEGKL